jgi:RNA ligase (TIGR02306 family)
MENQNSVAFVAKISEIKEIPGADNIEQAFIGGWSCIVKKGAYKTDELVICTTTDAVIPEDLAEKMNITSYLRSGNRVRTVKLRGVYSECLIIPKTLINIDWNRSIYEGKDVMEVLGIYKYEAPIKQIQLQLASGKKVRYYENPNFQVYYKFPNIKNVKGMFNEEDLVQITRKLHGTNARYGIVKKKNISLWDKIKRFLKITDEWYEYEFVAGSHNVEKGSDSQGFYDSNVWYTIADKYKIKEKLWSFAKQYSTPKNFGAGFVIYGEIYGAGIQKNYDYGLTDTEFAVFDIMENGHYYGTETTFAATTALLELPHVDVLYKGDWSQEIQDRYVLNNFIPGTKVPHEGVVIKDLSGERNKIAKVINPDYLIHGEKHDIGDSH